MIKAVKIVEQLLHRNAPTILAGVGVVGTCATGYLAVRGTSRAIRKIEEVEENGGLKWSEMSKPVITRSRVMLVFPYFLPAVGAGAVTISCIVMGNRMSVQRAAALAAAYSLSEAKLTEYKHKIEEKFGIETKNEVETDILQDRIRAAETPNMIILGNEEVLCFDAYSGRYFKSNQTDILRAVNSTNHEAINHGFATLEFFWEEIGTKDLAPTAYSDEFGWTKNCLLRVNFKPMISGDDRPALAVNYDVEPVRGWNPVFNS